MGFVLLQNEISAAARRTQVRPDTGLFHCGSRKLLWWLGVAACQNKTAKASDKGKMGWGEGRPVFPESELGIIWGVILLKSATSLLLGVSFLGLL